jgi:hypothetical protein
VSQSRPAFRCELAHVDARLGRVTEATRALDHLARDEVATAMVAHKAGATR